MPPSRGRGRGRGHVRGANVGDREYRNNDAPSRHLSRGRDRDRDRDRDRERDGSSRWESRDEFRGRSSESEHMNGNGRGRGRGRGRGGGINVPAWMHNDRLKREFQKEGSGSLTESRPSPRREKRSQSREEKKTETAVEATKTADANRADKELTRRQREEEEELKKLADQFGDADDDKDDKNMFNMLETDENEEEKLARERRDKRRKRMRELQPHSDVERLSKKQTIDSSLHVVERSTLREEQKEISDSDNKQENPLDDLRSAVAENTQTENDGIDSFDMFSTNAASDSPPTQLQKTAVTASGAGLDDAEGYYRATIGEIISFTPNTDTGNRFSFRVQGIIGKGVFSTVLKCSRIREDEDSKREEDIIAMKLIRSNETMAKAAQKEVRILRLLQGSGSKSRQANHIVHMFELDSNHDANDYRSVLLEHQNHSAILFEHLPFNLRETLSKFGRNVGINLPAVKSYAKQLLFALKHLELKRVVHADIKLDNILISPDFTTLKLCDFGSAFFETDSDLVMTPYLVSRFYRAPEIMLGLTYDRKIDLWSVAVSLSELFTGSVLFPGRNNNDMLKRFMESKGAFSNKMIRRHIASLTQLGLSPHFEPIVEGGSNYNFREQDFDKVTGKPVIRRVGTGGAILVPKKQMTQILLRSRSATDSRTDVQKFGDFLSKCLALDPMKRMNVDEALAHDFFV